MADLQKLKKAELLERCKRLQEEKEELEKQIDDLNGFYVEMENELAERINALDRNDYIKDMRWFRWQLQAENLMTPELADFIEDYLQNNNLICEW